MKTYRILRHLEITLFCCVVFLCARRREMARIFLAVSWVHRLLEGRPFRDLLMPAPEVVERRQLDRKTDLNDLGDICRLVPA